MNKDRRLLGAVLVLTLMLGLVWGIATAQAAQKIYVVTLKPGEANGSAVAGEEVTISSADAENWAEAEARPNGKFFEEEGKIYFRYPDCPFSAPQGMIFTGWLRKGTEEIVQPGYLTLAKKMTLIAQWAKAYKLTFMPMTNGAIWFSTPNELPAGKVFTFMVQLSDELWQKGVRLKSLTMNETVITTDYNGTELADVTPFRIGTLWCYSIKQTMPENDAVITAFFQGENTSPTEPDDPVTSQEQFNAKFAMNGGFLVRWEKNRVKVTWGKAKKADRCEVYASSDNDSQYKLVATLDGSKTSYTFSRLDGVKLDPKAIVAVKVKASRKVGDEETHIASTITGYAVGPKNEIYTNVKKITGVKSSVILKQGETLKLDPKMILEDSTGKLLPGYCKTFRYASTNTGIVKVSEKGRLTAVKPGSCKIYIFAKNGIMKKVKVTVE